MKSFHRLALSVALCLLASATRGFGADATNTSTTTAVVLPAPVAGYPIGWCIRAKTNVFGDAKNAGFEYVELALQDVLNLSEEDFQILKSSLQSLNLRALSGYNSIPKDLKLVGPEVDQSKLEAHLNRLLERAAALKLTYLILNAGGSWRMPDGSSREEALKQLAAFGRHFAESASKHNITVLIEPLRGTDSNLITNVTEAVQVVDSINHPNFQMMVDYSFLTIQGEDPKVLAAAGKHLRHIHISNPAANRSYPMNEGESDYAAFFRVLKQIGYRGGLSVHGSTQAFTDDAPRAITFLRKKAGELSAR